MSVAVPSERSQRISLGTAAGVASVTVPRSRTPRWALGGLAAGALAVGAVVVGVRIFGGATTEGRAQANPVESVHPPVVVPSARDDGASGPGVAIQSPALQMAPGPAARAETSSSRGVASATELPAAPASTAPRARRLPAIAIAVSAAPSATVKRPPPPDDDGIK